MSSENPRPTVTADPSSPTATEEPAGSPIKLFAIIALLLVALLIFGAMDS